MSDNDNLDEEPDRNNCLMKHAMHFVLEAFRNLKAQDVMGYRDGPNERTKEPMENERTLPQMPLGWMEWLPPLQPSPLAETWVPRTPLRLEPESSSWNEKHPPGIKIVRNPQHGFFLAHVLTYMQEYGQDFPT